MTVILLSMTVILLSMTAVSATCARR